MKMSLAILTGMTLAVLLIAAGIARCAEIKLAWNPNPAAENVTGYEVRAEEVWGLHEVVMKTTDPASTVTGLKPDVMYFFKVRAENAAGFSDFSPTVTAIPLPRYRVTIQKSDSLANWTDTETVLTGPAHGSGFFRLKIEMDDDQGVAP
jgi:hypothetical protein